MPSPTSLSSVNICFHTMRCINDTPRRITVPLAYSSSRLSFSSRHSVLQLGTPRYASLLESLRRRFCTRLWGSYCCACSRAFCYAQSVCSVNRGLWRTSPTVNLLPISNQFNDCPSLRSHVALNVGGLIRSRVYSFEVPHYYSVLI